MSAEEFYDVTKIWFEGEQYLSAGSNLHAIAYHHTSSHFDYLLSACHALWYYCNGWSTGLQLWPQQPIDQSTNMDVDLVGLLDEPGVLPSEGVPPSFPFSKGAPPLETPSHTLKVKKTMSLIVDLASSGLRWLPCLIGNLLWQTFLWNFSVVMVLL